MVILSINQAFILGFAIGHLFKISKFLSTWMLGSRAIFLHLRRFDIKIFLSLFIFNITLTIISLRATFDVARTLGLVGRKSWFISHNYYFSPLVAKYGTLVGAGVSVFDWIAGTLSNLSYLFTYMYSLYQDWINGSVLGQRQKMFLYRLWGIRETGLFKPLMALLPRSFESKIATNEIGKNLIISSGLVDSNMLSKNYTIPVPGNDDSIICISFFGFYTAKQLISLQIASALKWKNIKKPLSTKKKIIKLFFFLLFYKANIWAKVFYNYCSWIVQEFGVLQHLYMHEKYHYAVQPDYVENILTKDIKQMEYLWNI